MNKIELQVMAISRSVTQSANYAVVLGELSGPRRLPVIIGSTEAQAIAIAIEGMQGQRPLTHDLFKNTLETLRTELREVIISDLREGIFFARLVLDRDGEIIEVDSRTSDALALATRFECPIYTYENILESAGIVLEGDEEADQDDNMEMADRQPEKQKDTLSSFNVGELNHMLEEVLSQENYERAAEIRDELNRRKSN
ncbi:bifunctional nuclease family protein [Neolewinella agarilytica]|uniref:bifunctional nuclease family protein n=1 Tax=Neolewinella agarilytica TaxID=478744 RepID=UPI002352D4A0|nr:bifunctional nuclease domain-containing protein [Neolewinella agarilytica]